MAKQPRTRIKTEAELIRKIDRLLNQKERLRREADEMEQAAMVMLKTYCCNRRGDDPHLAHSMSLDAKRLIRQAKRVRGSAGARNRLDFYKQKLAELQTAVLPGIMADGSVAL